MPEALKLPSGAKLEFSASCLVMAIINCTDDSFYAPSRSFGERAVENALRAESEGAAIIDFGAESTRPGASYIDENEELKRLIPVVQAFRKLSRLPISIDTRKASVAEAALDSGADIINDISALCDDPRMVSVCAARNAAVILMHMKGTPRTMQQAPEYDNVLAEVGSFLETAATRAREAGIAPNAIIIDPGIGFGKRLEDNLTIIRRIDYFKQLPFLAEILGRDYPVLVALSRKSFIGTVLASGSKSSDAAADRLYGTLAANVAAVLGGADIIRVHDVQAHVDALKVLSAIRKEH